LGFELFNLITQIILTQHKLIIFPNITTNISTNLININEHNQARKENHEFTVNIFKTTSTLIYVRGSNFNKTNYKII